MKYSYCYKTSDGIRHEAAIEAESRDAAFAALRARGIRPIKVVAADGSKANGEIRGVRKRVVAGLVAFAAILAGAGVFIFGGGRTGRGDALNDVADFLGSETRRQVIGDTAIVEKGIATGWSGVFKDEGERFLASFAIPGVKAGQRNTTVEEIERALGRTVEVEPSDGIEARQIKAMVAGMKAEARRFITRGGSIRQYCRLLVNRQEEEIAIYRRISEEVEHASKTMDEDGFMALWEKRNAELRNIGLRTLALPE